jgi:hypothetical protein
LNSKQLAKHEKTKLQPKMHSEYSALERSFVLGRKYTLQVVLLMRLTSEMFCKPGLNPTIGKNRENSYFLNTQKIFYRQIFPAKQKKMLYRVFGPAGWQDFCNYLFVNFR